MQPQKNDNTTPESFMESNTLPNFISKKDIEVNDRLDGELQRNPRKMPTAVYYILPNEGAERFCFYGIAPILNPFFRDYLALGAEKAIEYNHLFKFFAYFSPLGGAAISDSFLGKYETIVALSFVYVVGTVLLAIFAHPDLKSVGGSLAGLFLIALGTGGIKPCVSAHGGDQFLDSQKQELNKFYNYFYLSINIGSIVSNWATPAIMEMDCFGVEKQCFTWAFGICSICMIIAWVVFMIGKRYYRVAPAAKIFLPWIILKANCLAFVRSAKNGFKTNFLDTVKDDFAPDIIEEVIDFNKMSITLLPAPFFWMAFDQNGSTWENQYSQMNPYWGALYVSPETSTIINPIFIVLLVPVFSNFLYPVVENRFGKIKLLDRMILGMFFCALAFVSSAVIQMFIDSNRDDVLEFSEEAEIFVCPTSEEDIAAGRNLQCMSGAWQIIPYFIITVGEVLFSISGLNFTYEEVGPRLKSSGASIWLLMVAIGNLLDVLLASAYTALGERNFFFLCTGLILVAMLIYVWVRKVYVYKADRPHVEVPSYQVKGEKN